MTSDEDKLEIRTLRAERDQLLSENEKLREKLLCAMEYLNKIYCMSDNLDNGVYACGRYHQRCAKEALAKLEGEK
jgi:hypothetical protein